MRRFLFWLTGRLPCRIIGDNGVPYLERYYLCTVFGVRFYLHRFVGSDPARGLHDHPWPWAGSIVLSGWYYEELRANGVVGSAARKVRWLNWLTGDTFHRVVLPFDFLEDKEIPCWTLFFHRAAYVKPWGFLRCLNILDTMLTWVPHNHPLDGSGTPGAWWEHAPRGRDESRRMGP